MLKAKRVIPTFLVLALMFGSVVFAGSEMKGQVRAVGVPEFSTNANTVTCKARVSFLGKSIDATLELYQGSTLVAWWTKTGTSSVSFSEPAPFISGLSYTLTISGTANGVAFTPASVTKTLW